MNIKRTAEIFVTHSSTFYVPARKTHTPWAVPLLYVIRLCLFPQRKVGRMAFLVVDLHSRTAFLVVEIDSAELPVSGEFFNRKINSVVRFVRIAFFQQSNDNFYHFGNIVGGFGSDRRTVYIERLKVVEKLSGNCVRYLFGRFFLFSCRLFHLVFAVVRVGQKVTYVGNIHNRFYFITRVSQNSTQRIHKHVSAHIADMCVIIDGWSA